MYPTLYHAFSDLFGLEIEGLRVVQSFGFFVAIAFLFASYLFTEEMKRKESNGLLSPEKIKVTIGKPASSTELLIAFIIGFAIGYKLLYIVTHFSEFSQDTQGFILSMKGSVLGGIIGGGAWAYVKYRDKQKKKLPKPETKEQIIRPHEHVGNMTIIAAVSGIIGAKVFHNLENIDEFMADPIDALLSFSGLTMYGGLIVGSISVLYYARKHKLNILHVADACAPGLMLAYAIGRIGCQVAGDGDWGIVNTAEKPGWMSFLPDWTWAYNYPHNVNNVGIPIPDCTGSHCYMLPEAVFPTPFYETVMCGVLFLTLWSIRKRIMIPGALFSIYLLFNGIERFLIESIRVNTKYIIFGNEITQAQIISSLLIILGISGYLYFKKKHQDAN